MIPTPLIKYPMIWIGNSFGLIVDLLLFIYCLFYSNDTSCQRFAI